MKIEFKSYSIIISITAICIIGLIDYYTGAEISFSLFYLIPVAYAGLGTKKYQVLVNSFFAALIWLLADYYGRIYSNEIIPYWNAFVRFSIFTIVGLLVLNLRDKYNKIAALNSELLTLNDEKNKLLGIASHDIRNPLGSIYSYSDYLTAEYSDKMDSEMFQTINYIKDLSKNSLDLVGKLLDVSRIESGVVELSLKPNNYIEFIKKYIELNQILAKKKGMTIKLESDEHQIILKFDELYMSEAINNLLTNAIKYSFSGSEVLVKISASEQKKIKTEVIDKGKGIPAEEQDKLFKYFKKTSTTPTGDETSTGLGLAIVKKIIINHGGTIGVNSEVGKGSNFYFELPV